MTAHRAITRAGVRWLIAATAVVAVTLSVAQPWYGYVSAAGDYNGLGQTADGFRIVFETGQPASPARTRTAVILQILLVFAAVAILVASRKSSRRGLLFAGAGTALAVAGGMSIYVLAATTAIWQPGLTWVWVAVGALGLLMSTGSYSPVRASRRPVP